MVSKTKMIVLIFSVCALIFASGCWDNNELDTISLVSGIGIDTADEEGKMTISIQIVKFQTSNGSESSADSLSYIMLEEDSETFREALEKLKLKNSRKIYLQHNLVIAIGKEQAQKGVLEQIDYLVRNTETRLDVKLVVAEGKAKDLLSAKPELEATSSTAIQRLINNLSSTSSDVSMNLLGFVANTKHKTSTTTLPVFKQSEIKDGLSNIEILSTAIFREGKMVDSLDNKESFGHLVYTGHIKDSLINIDTDDGKAVLKIIKMTSDKASHLRDGRIVINPTINGTITIDEVRGFEDYSQKDLDDLLTKHAKAEIYDSMNSVFIKSKEISADIFAIGNDLERYHYQDFKKVEKNWDENYDNAAFEPKINIRLVDTGKIRESLEKDVKKNENDVG